MKKDEAEQSHFCKSLFKESKILFQQLLLLCIHTQRDTTTDNF